LTKLIADVGARKRDPIAAIGHPDLFGHYKGIPQTIPVPAEINGRRTHLYKPFPTATAAEVEGWLSGDGGAPRSRRSRNKGVVAFLKDVQDFITSPQTTMREALEARSEALGIRDDGTGGR
jgi:hypothetical protein